MRQHQLTIRSTDVSTCSQIDAEKTTCCGDSGSDQPTALATKESIRLVRLQDAAKCHGIDMVWSLFSSVVLDFQAFELNLSPPPLLFRLSLYDEQASMVSLCPEPPVP